MKNIVYIKATIVNGNNEYLVYTTLMHLLRDMGIADRYMTIRSLLDKGKSFTYLNTIIKKSKIKHNERRKV